jgi:cellulose synthase/poly-beta-1,6-N-acetylglucosamine synthase-like glycosyltransferase
MSLLLVLATVVLLLVVAAALTLERWRDVLRSEEPQGMDAGLVTVSVVVPVRNGAETIVPLLQDLHAQDHPRARLEVIVVDDHSTDRTAARVRDMMPRWPQLHLVSMTSTSGKKAAITEGVAHATGDLVVLTDADARCGPQRIRRLAMRWAAQRPAIILAPVRTMADAGLLGLLQEEEQWALQAATAGSALNGTPVLANGANLAFGREHFLRVGGYQGDARPSGDDVYLLARMRAAGLQAAYVLHPHAAVTVEGEATWVGWWTQRLRWAGKMRDARLKGAWPAAMVAMAMPWMLVALTMRAMDLQVGEQALYTWCMVLAAWALWSVPVVRLVNAMKAVYGESPRSARSLLAVLCFVIYAPLVALVALVHRPRWKGRRT